MTSERARAGGGKETALQLNAGYTIGGTFGSGGTGWFGPGQPQTVQAPPETKGRAWDYPQAYNVLSQPRAYEAIGFAQLRAFADSYDLLRLIIEKRKDAMQHLKWVIQPKDVKMKMTPQMKNKVKAMTKLFRKPDGEHSWNTWLGSLLEDYFVIDAATLHRRRTRGGTLVALDQIDGAMIARVLDDWGRTPEEPGAVAYQQKSHGMVMANYTKDELYYRPKNVRVHKAYGYSPVEQLLMTINIGLRRQVFQLNFFTEGNVPAALIGVPETWTPDQIRVFQEWFDNILSGNLAERRKARFVPAAVGKTYVPTQETELFGKAEEWLARVTCFAFSVDPTPFIQMLRGGGGNITPEITATGMSSVQGWVKSLIDDILEEDMNAEDYEFIWKNDDELDPVKRQAISEANVKIGQITVNEGRVDQGREPYEDPIFDQPMFMTSNGLAPLALSPDAQGAGDDPSNPDPKNPAGRLTPPAGNNGDKSPSPKPDRELVEKMEKLIQNGDAEQLADFLRKSSLGTTPAIEEHTDE